MKADAAAALEVTALCVRWPKDWPPASGQAELPTPACGTSDTDAHRDRMASATQLVLAHGGRVEPSLAQAQVLSASFGTERLQADHAERALRCGLALLDMAPSAVNLCVGVHTGPVATMPCDSVPASGAADTADTAGIAQGAACLAQATPPGRLRLSLAAAAQVRGLFDLEPPAPLAMQGRATPLPSCLIRQVSRAHLQPTDDVRGPLVGRQQELAQMQDAFRRLFDTPQAAALTLLAEPGIGKSRLLHEFDAWAQAQRVAFHALHWRATAQSESQPFGGLAHLLRSFCQIDIDSTPQAARAQFEQALVPWLLWQDGADLAQGQAHMLGHLIGLDFAASPHVQHLLGTPPQLRQLALAAAVLWLRRLGGAGGAGGAPVLLQIEDLHWADSETLDFLEHVLQANHDLPLLVVSTSRPALADRRVAWVRSGAVHTRIDLGPLGVAAGRQLATGLLPRLREIPPVLLDRICAATQGNPFCIEERLKLLIDQGVLQTGSGGWALSATKLRTARLPSTLAGVLTARLNLLPAAERRALQQASVIGPVFVQDALLALGAGAVNAMRGLMQREMTLVHGLPGTPGTGVAPNFSFKHQLLQQLAYDTLRQPTRRALHGKLARWLLTLTGLQAGDVPGLAAHHFEAAGDGLQAAEQHARAAEQAASLSAAGTVRSHVQRGLALLGGLPASAEPNELRWRLLRSRVSMLESGSPRVEHTADLDALATLAEVLADDTRRALACESRCHFCMLTADYPGMKSAALEGMGWAARAGADGSRLGAMRMLAVAHLYMGDADAALRLVKQCLPQARELALVHIEGACLNTLAMIAQRQKDPVARLRYHEQELLLQRRGGNRRSEVLALANVGGAWQHLGDLVQSRRHAEEALRLARTLGHRLSECGALATLSTLERWLGHGAQAVALAQSSLEAARAIGMPNWESVALKRLGDALLVAGQPAAAAGAYKDEMAVALQHKLAETADSEVGLARAALALGDMPLALAHVQRVLDRDAVSTWVSDAGTPRRVELVCYLVLSSAGDTRADVWLQRAHAQLRTTAANIADDTLREGFLNNVPDHRAILAAWAMQEQERAAAPGSLAR
jgi:hypothetical protein